MTEPVEYCLGWEEFHRDCRSLARQLVQQPWQGILAITRGGLVPAAILARELNLRLVDTVCVASYEHTSQGDGIELIKKLEGDGSGFLLVDDLVDTGRTARYLRHRMPGAVFASVYAKPAGRPLADYVVRDFPQHVWIHFPWDIESRYSPPLATGAN